MVQDIQISFAPYNKTMSQVSEAELCNPEFRRFTSHDCVKDRYPLLMTVIIRPTTHVISGKWCKIACKHVIGSRIQVFDWYKKW